MEEGGGSEIMPCYNKCNKDHLATVKGSSETKKEINSDFNKQWLVCGYNGFGQFNGFKNKRKLQQLQELQIPLSCKNSKILVACSWNCLVFANECNLELRGFISNSPNTLKTLKTEVPIKSLDICDIYCLILLTNGKVYKLLLKHPDELNEIVFQTCLIPLAPQKRGIFGDYKTSEINNLEIDHIACGNNITVAISTLNAVFSGTIQIFQFPKHQRTKQLKCGFEHAILLTTNGDVYAWGNGLRGQLGLEILRVEETPTLIEALAGIKIIYIAASGWHSAAISTFGDLYTWGFNSNGQLGLRIYKTASRTLREPTVYPLPQIIDLPTCQCSINASGDNEESTCFPLKVVAGGRHTIVLMNCGSLYATGWNLYGQLSLKKSQEYCDKFKFVLNSKDENNCIDKQIVCGNWCTLISK